MNIFGTGADGALTVSGSTTVTMRQIYENDNVTGITTYRGAGKGLNKGNATYMASASAMPNFTTVTIDSGQKIIGDTANRYADAGHTFFKCFSLEGSGSIDESGCGGAGGAGGSKSSYSGGGGSIGGGSIIGGIDGTSKGGGGGGISVVSNDGTYAYSSGGDLGTGTNNGGGGGGGGNAINYDRVRDDRAGAGGGGGYGTTIGASATDGSPTSKIFILGLIKERFSGPLTICNNNDFFTFSKPIISGAIFFERNSIGLFLLIFYILFIFIMSSS
jgi:hypothetical protein